MESENVAGKQDFSNDAYVSNDLIENSDVDDLPF